MKNIIIQNAMAHNKFLTKEYLDKKPISELLRFTHPIEREGFIKKLGLTPEESVTYQWKYNTKNE